MQQFKGQTIQPVFAPAKVNIHLTVKDRRPDGFHDLESIFLAVDFGDTLKFELLECDNSAEICMEGLDFSIPAQENIIFRSLCLFREKTGFSRGIKITAEKRIFAGSGLGGGSSNAAAVLLTLNKIAGSPLSRETLLEMAAVLGSDVPFFIHETAAAIITGRGDKIEPVKCPSLHLVLVYPGFSSDTAAAYRLLDDYRAGKNHPNDSMPLDLSAVRAGCAWFAEESGFFKNDFLEVFLQREMTIYSELLSALLELGACFTGLSGAGSACFGIFKESQQAQKAAYALRSRWKHTEHCRSLSEQY
ncbi:MAG: 4-(cytidine 5'-diphospho)-2-C-methyl-D-erythritol kinase [Treponema sp.]|nr:4-(cytidine 5'-diphospho)-2-C-methyl-D-erythritol kinase [Treponema sp.]